MTADADNRWLLPEARRAMNMARVAWSVPDYVATVQQAQACVEYCARAVIATYGEPSWGHAHSRDLNDVLEEFHADLRQRFGAAMTAALRQLARDDREMAPWHTRGMYGMRDADGAVHPPLEICTRAVAERALLLAGRSLETTESFLAAWSPEL